jgi:hypothetical protein
MYTSPTGTSDIPQPLSWWTERRSSWLSLDDKEIAISTREISQQPQCMAPDATKTCPGPPSTGRSFATTLAESEANLSQSRTLSVSGYSTKSFLDGHLPPAAVFPPAADRPNMILEESQPAMSSTHKVALILVACLAQFLSLGGMNQTVAPVMVLAKYFNINDYGTLSWFSAAYSMSVGTFILPAG